MDQKTNSEVVYFHVEVEGRKYLNSKSELILNNTIALEIDSNQSVSYGAILDSCLNHSEVSNELEPTTINKITLYLPEREPEQKFSEDNENYEGGR